MALEIHKKTDGKTKKYIVVGGYLSSRQDGDRHYVSASDLCLLYGIDHENCMMYETVKGETVGFSFHGESMPILKPRADGIYSLDEVLKNK